MIYKFKNLNFKYSGKDYLGSGTAHYVLDEYDDDTFEAGFDAAELEDVVGYSGRIKDENIIKQMNDAVVETLNRDDHLRRLLGR